MLEEEILYGKRAFSKTQELFEGSPVSVFFSNPKKATWYGTDVNPHRGAFCVVKEGEGLEDLVGEFLRILYRGRTINVYCLEETPDIDQPIALSRRAWNQIERLTKTEISIYARVLA